MRSSISLGSAGFFQIPHCHHAVLVAYRLWQRRERRWKLGSSVEQEVITGKVIDGYIAEAALVCLDLNANGRCDGGESQAFSDAAGAYQLTVAKNAPAPLVAEVIAGPSRDSDQAATAVDLSYRMASPSNAYSTDITPYTTLVHLSGESNLPLAEDLVRNDSGCRRNSTSALDPAAASAR